MGRRRLLRPAHVNCFMCDFFIDEQINDDDDDKVDKTSTRR